MPVDIARLRIVQYPDPVLRTAGQALPAVTDEVRQVARRMLELMHQAPGVGLAAPQVGLGWRLFVANATKEPGDDRVYINPVLSDPSRELEDVEEGCLSLPQVNAQIRRPVGITIQATDLEGKRFTETSSELPARIWQHEMDHLDGILIIDRMAPIDRLANRRALRDLEKTWAESHPSVQSERTTARRRARR